MEEFNMKINVLAATLIDGLKKVEKVINKNAGIPILQGVFMAVTKQEITLVGSDNTETIIHCMPVDGESIEVFEEGKVVLPKAIIEIVKKFKKTVSLTLKGTTLEIESGRSNFELNCYDVEEYPKISNVADFSNPILTLKGTEFKNLISKTAFAASANEARPILTGVCFEVNKDGLNIVSTDSHRLGKVQLKATVEHEAKFIVPAKNLENALKAFNDLLDVELFVQDDTQIIFKNGPTYYYTRLLEGNYPDTSRLIPKESKAQMAINRKELLSGLECIAGICNQSETAKGVVKLHINGVVTLSTSQSQTGKGQIEVPYEEFEGMDEFTIALSLHFLTDAIKALSSEVVTFEFTQNLRPVVVTPYQEVDSNELHLILPVRIA